MKRLEVYYKKLSEWRDPQEVFSLLFGKKDTVFWLDSSRVEEGLSRFSYMGEASEVISYTLTDKLDIFSVLQKQLNMLSTNNSYLPFDFVGGFVGYFGYELKALAGSKNKYRSRYPDSLWFFVDKFLAFDHKQKEVYLVFVTSEKKKAAEWFEKMKLLLYSSSDPELNEGESRSSLVSSRLPSSQVASLPRTIHFSLARSHEQYLRDIQTCKEYLRKGESYQICLTNSISANIQIDPYTLYLHVRKANPAPYAAFFKHKDFAVLCSSPERFLQIDKKRVIESKPIKGTRKRSEDTREDKKLMHQLTTSEKDRAENLMITDLLRNDIGKVATIGSVEVPKLTVVESYATVHQLVSTVRGKLRDDVSSVTAIRACFPGGSMTGAPKLRTMEVLECLEKSARGVYAGALGFLSINGCVDLNIVIRTIVQKGNTVSIGAGGAILIQSDPEAEYAEMMLKAKILLEVITKATGAKEYTID